MTIKLAERLPLSVNQGEEPMGEIRVDVTLVNAIDEGIARRGGMPVSEVRQCQELALVDTGAVRACVPVDVVQKLGIATTGRSLAEFADGRREVVAVTEPIRFEIVGRSTAETALVVGNEVLIGQTILESTDLWADCRGRRLVPNPAHPDQPVFKIK